jgi:predicted metal-dependent hydrolase
MPVLQIGKTAIEYELCRSSTASQRRITVTPDRVEVLVLAGDHEEDVAGFLTRKRRWVFDTVREMERIAGMRHAVPRFLTGSKILYRGRKMSLTVRRTDAESIAVTYRNGFVVDLPAWAGRDTDRLVATELKLWLKQRARRDVLDQVAAYGPRHDLMPRSVRVVELANSWGSCGADGNITINWHLIFAPRRVLDYVVAHELAHLRVRSHGPEFWSFLGSLCPAWEEAKLWLDHHQTSMSADFLAVNASVGTREAWTS